MALQDLVNALQGQAEAVLTEKLTPELFDAKATIQSQSQDQALFVFEYLSIGRSMGPPTSAL
jgi:hypothetical protein